MADPNLSERVAQLFEGPQGGLLRDVLTLLAAFVAGLVAKAVVESSALGHRVNLIFASHRADAADREGLAASGRFRPARLAGWLVAASLFALGVWFVLGLHGDIDRQAVILALLKMAWSLAAVLVVAGLAARLVTGSVARFLESPPLAAHLDRLLPDTSKARRGFSALVADAAAILIYILCFLLAAIVAAELFGWRAAAGVLSDLWQFAVRVLAAALVLALGYLGIRWIASEDRPAEGGPAQPETDAAGPALRPSPPPHGASAVQPWPRAMAAVTVILAIITLSGFLVGPGIALVILLILIVAVMAYRDYVAEAGAGLYLALKNVTEVTVEGEPARLRKRGVFLSEWEQGGGIVRIPNRTVMNALLGGIQPKAESPEPEAPPAADPKEPDS